MPHALSPGKTAPTFTASTVFGKKLTLADSASKYTLLVFLRYSGCPWCNLAIHRLAVEQKLLAESRCQVVAFIQSTAENIKQNIYSRHKQKPTFPIVADKTQQFYRLYDVRPSVKSIGMFITQIPQWLHAVKQHGFSQHKIDGNLLMVPAYFLVGEGQQKILHTEYSANFFDDTTFSTIYQHIASDRLS